MLLWIDFAKVTFGITLKPIFVKSLNCPCDTSLKSKFWAWFATQKENGN